MMRWSKILQGSCAIATSGALMLSSFPAIAQDQPPAGAQLPPPAAVQQPPQPAGQQLGQGELEKLLAPIALYPDDLVAQILTASTYPIEVVEAARWLNAHPNVHGNGLQDAMQQQPWDPSVKGLTAVPQVLSMMNDKLDWTQQLGEAFLAQPNDVSNAIQQLRAKAQANGNLKSSDKIRVSTVAPQGPPPPPPAPEPVGVDAALLPPPQPAEYIAIEPVDPGVYYVPIYDPYVVYGPWLWPAYAPFYWYPPGYVLGAAVIGFSVGFFVGSALWCHYNWGGGWGSGWGGRWGSPVTINVTQYNQFNRTNIVAGSNGVANWQFNPAHRGTVGFQSATLRQQFGGPTTVQGAQSTLRSSLQGTQGALHGALQGNQDALHGTLQGNQGALRGLPQGNHLPLTRGGTGPVNANVNTNANIQRNFNVNRNQNVNTNANIQRNFNVNRNQNVNTNANIQRNLNVNRNQNVNTNANIQRNLNVNRNLSANRSLNPTPNVNRNFNAGANFNRSPNFSRNAGRTPPSGGKEHH
jgi:hypothetical protein